MQLNEYERIAVSLAVLAAGWLLARFEHTVVALVMRLALAALGLLFLVLVLTGLQHEEWGEIHRWSGHLLTIGVWVWVMFALGVVWQQYWPWFGAILFRSGLLIVCVGLGLLAGFSGFLGPTNNRGADQETYNRFIFLHYFVVPIFLTASVGLFSWGEGRKGKKSGGALGRPRSQ